MTLPFWNRTRAARMRRWMKKVVRPPHPMTHLPLCSTSKHASGKGFVRVTTTAPSRSRAAARASFCMSASSKQVEQRKTRSAPDQSKAPASVATACCSLAGLPLISSATAGVGEATAAVSATALPGEEAPSTATLSAPTATARLASGVADSAAAVAVPPAAAADLAAAEEASRRALLRVEPLGLDELGVSIPSFVMSPCTKSMGGVVRDNGCVCATTHDAAQPRAQEDAVLTYCGRRAESKHRGI